MERDDRVNDVTDEQLLALYRSVEPPAPSADFVARTMRAVARAPLPARRKALRDPLAAMFGWAAVIAAVALAVLATAFSQPIIASSVSRLITGGVGTAVWLMQFTETGLRLLAVQTTMGLAVSRAAVTAEGTTALVVTAVVGALALSALHRLLISEGEDAQWQEFS